MCTILGSVGTVSNLPSRLRQEYHEFMSCLFSCGELRGRDASGFWAWRDNHYLTEKRPIPAQDLIYRSMQWKSLRFNPPSICIAHTRSTTDGDPNVNSNNHPHIGSRTVMVHNGMVASFESIAKHYGFEMKTSCDSEILIHLAESKPKIEDGLEHMMKTVNITSGFASVATAFVDRKNPNNLYLVRNNGNPLFIYKCPRLNSIFFVSTSAIFEEAMNMMYGHKSPINAGFVEKTSLDVHKLYTISTDGVIETKSLTVHNPSTNVGFGTTGYKPQDKIKKQSTFPLAYPDVGGEDYSLDMDGSISLFIDEEEKDDASEKKQQLPGVEDMPENVRQSLVKFLEDKDYLI